MAKLGLVTVLFNSDSVLDGFFKSLASQIFTDYLLFIIDNTSNSETDQLLKELSIKYAITNYVHIKNSKNEGVAKGNNQGIELSIKQGSTHTLLLNNDIEFEQPGLLAEMLDYAERSIESIIIPKIYFYDTRKVWMAGGQFQMLKGSTIHIGEGDEDGPKYNTEKYFKYAPTCFMLIKNNVFSEIGVMDEKYFVYYDDTDFMYRAYKHGYKVKFLPQFHVYHKVSSLTGGSESSFTIFYGNRNRIYFINKNFRNFNYLCSMLFVFASRFVIYIKYDKKQREQLLKAITEGLRM